MARIEAIFADWGTTNRRAWAVDRDGNVLDQRKDDQGLLGVKDRAFEPSFRAFIGEWLKAAAPAAPIVMAGMVGSKLGWREAPYVETPAKFGQLAEHLVALPDLDGHPIRIAPGLSAREDGRPDVMRGEECQLYGLWLKTGANRLCVLPGTHSKWAEIRDGGLAGFRTYMTGELFSQLCTSGTLAQLMRPGAPHDDAAFRRGLAVSEGASAGIIGCFSDPALAAIRETVAIPVVGPGQASIALVCESVGSDEFQTVHPNGLPTPSTTRRLRLCFDPREESHDPDDEDTWA